MQFTTLFSIATSIAIANAGIVKNRQADPAVATIVRFSTAPTDATCNPDNSDAQVVHILNSTIGACMSAGSEGWPSIQVNELKSPYWFRAYTTEDCSINDDTTASVAASGDCEGSSSGKPWLSYQVTTPDQ